MGEFLGWERVASGLDFPTSLALDGEGALYVAESGLPFGGARPGGRVRRIGPGGDCPVVLEGLRPPVNGLTWSDGGFYVSEGGFPGRISRWAPGGPRETVLDGLPARGNYHTNMVAVGPDGWLYFSQGAMTNSGVVGLDAYDMAWLKQLPHPCDLPGYDIALSGQLFETPDPLAGAPAARALTRPFAPFGDASDPEARVPGRAPCTAAVMRCRPDGTGLELVAWGLRNAYGLGFLPDGRLLATEQGPDDRGSRPIGGAPDLLYEIKPGAWYGWPDFVGGRAVDDPSFRPSRGPHPRALLVDHDSLPVPEAPLLSFGVNAAATKFAVLPAASRRWPGQLLVAIFGDEKPATAPRGPKVGRTLLRVDPADWSAHPLDRPGLERPIDVAASPDGSRIFVLDFGRFEMLGEGRIDALSGSGAVYAASLE
jgi:glucose/arabinose dehydrogenase